MNIMDKQKQFTDRLFPLIIRSETALPFEANIAAYKAWEEELPILNTKVTANMLCTAAQAVLSSNISAVEKFNLAEQTLLCLSRVYLSCKESMRNAKLPLAKKEAELISQLLTTLTSFNHLYLDIICSADFLKTRADAEQNNTPPFPHSEKSRVLFRAIELLGLSQFLMSLIYQLPKADFWNVVNVLFATASLFKLHQLEHLNVAEEQTATIENEFKKIHLFYLAQTNRFKQRDIETIHSILSLRSDDIEISKTADNSPSFYVDLESSSTLMSLDKLNPSSEENCFFNTLKLIQFMHSDTLVAPEKIGAIVLAKGKPFLSKEIIHQLITSWGTGQTRKSSRREQTEQIMVYPGFESIIRALMVKNNPDVYGQHKKPATGSAAFELPDLELMPAEEGIHRHHDITQRDSTVNKMLKASSDHALSAKNIWNRRHESISGAKGEEMIAETLDVSLEGLQFSITGYNKSLLKAGDLIGIQTLKQSLQLAIIRRINSFEEGTISVGVEMMSPNIKIANIRYLDKKTPPKPALFLQGIPSNNQPDAIISPLSLENTEVDLVLSSKNEKTYFSLDKIIQTNQVFSHYSVLKKTNLE
ncbi:MAG: GTPase-translation elongation factor [Cycloclasticus sp.]